MDKFLVSLLVAIVVLLFILFAMFFLLVFYRIREVKNKMRITRYIEERQVDWYEYLLGDDMPIDSLKPNGQLELEAIDELFFRFSYHFSSDEINDKVNAFAEHYMNDYYSKGLGHRSSGIRINTLNKINLFNLTFMLDKVSRQLQKKKSYSKTEYILMYEIISRFSKTEFMAHFIHPKVSLGEFDYKKLLMELDETQISLLAEDFNELPEVLQLATIEIVGVRHYLEWLPLLHECLDSSVQELRIRALKSIAELEVADALELYEGFSRSTVWEERLMTAKIFRSVSSEKALPVLNHLIKDSTYQVRAQAAKSMKSLKNGQQALYSVITTSSDEFAIDVAEEMFGKE
ncbi:HEAT repeat domain-containing protein [Sporosarcina ureae]|uniref:HEAT repeat domain-containing protein n=1 Tax=Sporosarcina ureae TaxID=1571 RepID=UPI0026F19A40|nr:HEAT repeat domain-containing protein [Sporosarcina ureae]